MVDLNITILGNNMVDLVKLKFELVCGVDYELSDDLGEYIAHDVLCEIYNGEDVIDVRYVGSELC